MSSLAAYSESYADQITGETTAEIIPEDLKEKLKPIGIITCEFYFLNNPRRNSHLHGAQKDIEALQTVSEKAIKGDALSHQTVLVTAIPCPFPILLANHGIA